MRRLNDLIAEDTNQFGPGTDLMVSLMAVLLVMVLISGHLYRRERTRGSSSDKMYEQEKRKHEALKKSYEDLKKEQAAFKAEGNIRRGLVSFESGNFFLRPVDKLVNPEHTNALVDVIVEQYRSIQNEYPYIFVIGHANQVDAPTTEQDYRSKLQRNWEYGGRRAGAIADLIQMKLTDWQKEKIIVMSAGELDLKNPEDPTSQENAFVEIIFGKWLKPPAREGASSVP
jgi:hypothetical protein